MSLSLYIYIYIEIYLYIYIYIYIYIYTCMHNTRAQTESHAELAEAPSARDTRFWRGEGLAAVGTAQSASKGHVQLLRV